MSLVRARRCRLSLLEHRCRVAATLLSFVPGNAGCLGRAATDEGSRLGGFTGR